MKSVAFAITVAMTIVCVNSAAAQSHGHNKKAYIYKAPCIAGHVHHSSTVAEGYGRGMAAMIQAQGYYNLATSQAMINVAEAQLLQMELHQKKIEKYAAMRQAAKNRRAPDREVGLRNPAPNAAHLAIDD